MQKFIVKNFMQIKMHSNEENNKFFDQKKLLEKLKLQQNRVISVRIDIKRIIF